jgi:pyridoxal phosphate enzyme (YggS family)
MPSNLREIQDRITRSCEGVGRDPASVTLVAVSKLQPVEAIQGLYDLGVRDFGESRLQEAVGKMEALPSDIRWHFIGHLQSNKARQVGASFDWIHTVCTEAQLREFEKGSRRVRAMIEINIANEPQKSGISQDALDGFITKALNYKYTQICGLMTIGPAGLEAEEMRGYFREVRGLNEKIGGTCLSMGMSGNFDVAIQEGATHIRVGTALFGAR